MRAKTTYSTHKTLGHARASITADLNIGRISKALQRAADRYGDVLDPDARQAAETGDDAMSRG